MKNKIFLSSILLVSCFIVFIFSVFAWFTLDDNTNASDINMGVIDIDCDVELYYLEDSNWIQINTLSNDGFALTNPGDYTYFKIIFITDRTEPISVSNLRFTGLASNVTDELKINNNTLYVTDNENNNIDLYNIVDNKVEVDSKTLYTINDNVIELSDFKLHNCLRFYNLDNAPTTAQDELIGSALTLDNNIFSEAKEISLNNDQTIFFALELNFDAMKENDIDYSYCYQYQNFSIYSLVANVD